MFDDELNEKMFFMILDYLKIKDDVKEMKAIDELEKVMEEISEGKQSQV